MKKQLFNKKINSSKFIFNSFDVKFTNFSGNSNINIESLEIKDKTLNEINLNNNEISLENLDDFFENYDIRTLKNLFRNLMNKNIKYEKKNCLNFPLNCEKGVQTNLLQLNEIYFYKNNSDEKKHIIFDQQSPFVYFYFL